MKKNITAVILLSAAILAGCGAEKSDTFTYTTAARSLDQAYETAAAQAGGAMNEDSLENLPTEPGLNSTNTIRPVQTNRKLIRTVELQVETTQFDAHLETINALVEERQGYMEQSSISGNSMYHSGNNRRYASLTIRIPSDTLSDFVTQVGNNVNITSKNESTEDVTLQYTDIESRKKSLIIEQERLWELLEKADSVDSIIALESRLSEIRYQLESMESQLRTYDNQVDYSTVYLYIDEVSVITPTSPDTISVRIQKGFQRSFENVCTAVTDFVVWFLSNIPALILFFAVLAIVIGLIHLLIRILKHKKTKIIPPIKEQNSAKKSKTEQMNHPSQQ